LSWVTEKDDPDLRKIIKDASDQNIAVFCSRGDQGNLSSPKYPADFPGTITVSATDRKNVRRKHSEEKADFFVVGEDILADGPSYYLGDGAEHLDHLCSGSSVATAVAAGLASLIVAYATCCQETGSKCIVTQRDIMVSLMKRCMCPPTPDGKSGYIDVRAFGPPLNERPNMDAHRRFAATLRAY
jgi:hypothetical protein